MAAAKKITLEKQGAAYVVRDPASGAAFQLKGYGAMRGLITFRADLDLTKPIAEQVAKGKPRKPSARKTAATA